LLLLFFIVFILSNSFRDNFLNGFVLLAVFGVFFSVTLYNLENGTLFFVFTIPLFQIIGRFYGVSRFLTIFFIFTGVIAGLIVKAVKEKRWVISWEKEITKPVFIFMLFITVSFVFVYLRIHDYFSLYNHAFRDYFLNVDLKTTDNALWLAIYQYLNYFSGFLILYLVYSLELKKSFLIKLFYTFFASSSLVFVGALYQVFVNPFFMGQATGIGTQSWIGENTFANRYGSTLVDPNSLGIYSIMMLLVFIGFAIYLTQKKDRVFAIIAAAECFVLLFLSGSRTGLLGIIIILLFYFFILIRQIVIKVLARHSHKTSGNKKIFSITAGFLVIFLFVLLLLVIVLILKVDESILPVTLKRIKVDLGAVISGNFTAALKDLLGGRLALWKAAGFIIRDYPVSGAGIGMVTVELPNYGFLYSIAELPRDLADNYYLQVASELGMFALAANLWIFGVVLKSGKILIRGLLKEKNYRWFFLNLYLVLPVMLFMFIFGPHTYFIEIMFLLFLIIGIVLKTAEAEQAK